MAEKAERKEVQADILEPIETLKERLGIGAVVFAGTKMLKGWRTGKQVTEAAFKAACKEFLESPVDGAKRGAKG